jgi:hypothetical protein
MRAFPIRAIGARNAAARRGPFVPRVAVVLLFRFHVRLPPISSYESVAAGPRSQLLYSVKPIFIRRSLRTTASLPEFMSERRDILVPKRDRAMSGRSLRRVFQSLPRLLVSGQVILFPVLFADTVSMRGAVLQFGGALMVFVMRSVVIASRHIQIRAIRADLS